MRNRARAENNTVELSELEEVTVPFANGTQLFLHRKWLAILMGQRAYSQKFVENWAVAWLPLFNEASGMNLFKETPSFLCPVYFMVGDRDYQTWFKLTEEYYKKVSAPRKEIFWFDHAAHSFLTSGQEKVQEIILKQSLTNTPN